MASALAKNHAFVDGNKRAAFLARRPVSCDSMDIAFVAEQAVPTLTMLAVAAGDIDEPAFAAWIREHSRKR